MIKHFKAGKYHYVDCNRMRRQTRNYNTGDNIVSQAIGITMLNLHIPKGIDPTIVQG